MKNIFTTLLLLTATLFSMQAAVVTYQADDLSDFPNPERGYYQMAECHLIGSSSPVIEDWLFTSATTANRSLILRHYYLDHYSNGNPITQADLNTIAADMAKFRQFGLKAILRFSYGNVHTATTYSHEATEQQMYDHMKQLKPVLAANADVIAVVQAGFIGVWGEWYYSYQFGTNCANDYDARNRVTTKLLDMVPADRFLQLRTPEFIADYIGGGHGTANYKQYLTSGIAFNGSNRSRLGHHNDAFCNGVTNQGTYSSNETTRNLQIRYLSHMGQYAPMGGETDLGSWQTDYMSLYNTYHKGSKAAESLSYQHFDYLNYSYSKEVTDRWKTEMNGSESWYKTISRKLGYRFELVNTSFPTEAKAGSVVLLNLNIKNTGYSRLYNMRKVYLVLRSSSKEYRFELDSDPRFWKDNGAITNISQSIQLPSNIPAGTYQLSLAMPDPYTSIASNPKFAVRFANPGVWDSSRGENKLLCSVSINSNPNADMTFAKGNIRVDLGTATSPAQKSSASTVKYELSTDSVLTVEYSTTSAWLYTGVSFPMGSLSNVDSISFDYVGSLDVAGWTGLLPVIEDGKNRWYDGASRPVMDETWRHAKVIPSVNLWSTATGSYGDRAITTVSVLVNPKLATTASFAIKNLVVYRRSSSYRVAANIVNKQDTAIETTKLMRNGQIIILRDGVEYNALGQRIE